MTSLATPMADSARAALAWCLLALAAACGGAGAAGWPGTPAGAPHTGPGQADPAATQPSVAPARASGPGREALPAGPAF